MITRMKRRTDRRALKSRGRDRMRSGMNRNEVVLEMKTDAVIRSVDCSKWVAHELSH
jgi:hypothetical protein